MRITDTAPLTVGHRAPGEAGQRRRDGAQDADDADLGHRQRQPVDLDQGVQRTGRDEAGAVERLCGSDPSEGRPATERGPRFAGREARCVRVERCLDAARGHGAQGADGAREGDHDHAPDAVGEDAADQQGHARRGGLAGAHEADESAALRGWDTWRPTSAAGAGWRRRARSSSRWPGRPSRAGWAAATMTTSSSAPPARNRLMPRVVRGPSRLANRPRTLAANGAAASSAMPTGSRPWWRATPGSSDRTTDAVMPTPTRETRSSSTLRRNVSCSWKGPRRPDDAHNEPLECPSGPTRSAVGLGCYGNSPRGCSAISPNVRVGPPSSEEVRPETILPRRRCDPTGRSSRSGPMPVRDAGHRCRVAGVRGG